jgi:hypothetical protein
MSSKTSIENVSPTKNKGPLMRLHQRAKIKLLPRIERATAYHSSFRAAFGT